MEDFPQNRLYDVDEVINKRKKIIIADDNELLIDSIKTVVQGVIQELNCNYDILTASDGVEILNFVKKDQVEDNLIKCIIIDEKMEFMSGSQTIKIIRDFEKKRKLKPIGVISCYLNEDEVVKNEISEVESQVILSKPFDAKDLKMAFESLSVI